MNQVLTGFGWQGLRFSHPIDWAPVTLSGNRQQGYARIASPDSTFLQLRWRRGESKVNPDTVERYLQKIAADARRGKSQFSQTVKSAGHRIEYSYKSVNSAKGVLFPMEDGRGIVFLEVVNGPRSMLNELVSDFRVQDSDLENWCLHGLNVNLPNGLKLDGHELKAGKTRLQLSGSKVQIVAERWGFAENLLQGRTLLSWVKALTGIRPTAVDESPDRVSLVQTRPLLGNIAIKSEVQKDQNQITVIRSETRSNLYQPQWTWFEN